MFCFQSFTPGLTNVFRPCNVESDGGSMITEQLGETSISVEDGKLVAKITHSIPINSWSTNSGAQTTVWETQTEVLGEYEYDN